MYSTPILYIVFNRPEETAKSFEVFRKLKPSKLYIAADGARHGRQDDVENTKKVKAIVSQIDWDCDIKTLFHPTNLGCRVAVQTALDWFFENETEGIIIEDDIIPNDGFFEFCETMLERYRDDERILTINGCSLGYQNDKQPYGKTRYFNMWGWATWRSSVVKVKETWANYNPHIPLQADPIMKKNLRLPILFDGNALWSRYWEALFIKVYEDKINTWDYQWCYTVLKPTRFASGLHRITLSTLEAVNLRRTIILMKLRFSILYIPHHITLTKKLILSKSILNTRYSTLVPS